MPNCLNKMKALFFVMLIITVLLSRKFFSDALTGEEWISSEDAAFHANDICILQLHYRENNGAEVQRAALIFSTDNGKKWKRTEIQFQSRPIDINFDSEGALWLWFDSGILWRSKPPFASWAKERGVYLPSSNISQISMLPDNKIICYAMTNDGFQYKWFVSEDGGKLWTKLSKDDSCEYVYQAMKGQALFLRLCYKEDLAELEISNDGGKIWNPKGILRWGKMLIPDSGYEQRILRFFENSILFAGTSRETRTTANFSVDAGQTWNLCELNPETYKDNPRITDAIILGKNKALITMSDRIMATTDAGKNWKCVWGPKKDCWLDKCYQSPKGEVWVIGNRVLRSKDGIKFKEVNLRPDS